MAPHDCFLYLLEIQAQDEEAPSPETCSTVLDLRKPPAQAWQDKSPLGPSQETGTKVLACAPGRLRGREARARAARGRTPELHSSPSTPRCLALPRKPPAFGPLPAPPELGCTLAAHALSKTTWVQTPHLPRAGVGGWGLAPWPGASHSSGLCSWVPGSTGRDAKSIPGWHEQGGSSYIASRVAPGDSEADGGISLLPPSASQEPGMLLGPQFSRCLVPANCGRVCLS